MTKKTVSAVTRVVLAVGIIPSCLLARQENENNVIMGPHYEKEQHSQRALVFVVPENCVKDEKGAKKLGMYSVLVPVG